MYDMVHCVSYVVKVLLNTSDIETMQLLYTPSEEKQLLAQHIFIEHETTNISYRKLAKKYGYHYNYILSLSHWYRDHGKK